MAAAWRAGWGGGSATWHIAGAGGMSGAYCKNHHNKRLSIGAGYRRRRRARQCGPGKQSKFGSLVFWGGGYRGIAGATSLLPVISGGGAPGVSIFSIPA